MLKLTIFSVFRCARAAQSHLVGRVFETPALNHVMLLLFVDDIFGFLGHLFPIEFTSDFLELSVAFFCTFTHFEAVSS
jgi:hypothetical protein